MPILSERALKLSVSPIRAYYYLTHKSFCCRACLLFRKAPISVSSPSALNEFIFCSSKYIPTPRFLSSLTAFSKVTIFHANLDADFVITRSILPLRQFASNCWKPDRLSFVPVRTSSEYTPTYSKSPCDCMYSL